VRLTMTAKIFIATIIVGVVASIVYFNPELLGRLAPSAKHKESNIPDKIDLPEVPFATAVDAAAGCPSLPEVRF